MIIPTHEQREFMIYAFRYALGRKTYATSTVSNVIRHSWDEITKHDKELIQREIREAIELGLAGDDCDVRSWQSLLHLCTEKIEEGEQ